MRDRDLRYEGQIFKIRKTEILDKRDIDFRLERQIMEKRQR